MPYSVVTADQGCRTEIVKGENGAEVKVKNGEVSTCRPLVPKF